MSSVYNWIFNMCISIIFLFSSKSNVFNCILRYLICWSIFVSFELKSSRQYLLSLSNVAVMWKRTIQPIHQVIQINFICFQRNIVSIIAMIALFSTGPYTSAFYAFYMFCTYWLMKISAHNCDQKCEIHDFCIESIQMTWHLVLHRNVF